MTLSALQGFPPRVASLASRRISTPLPRNLCKKATAPNAATSFGVEAVGPERDGSRVEAIGADRQLSLAWMFSRCSW
jgi:hypothetical protein